MDTMTQELVIVETSVWVDYFRDVSSPETDWLEREIGAQRIGTLDLILCEVLQGIPRESEFREVKAQMLGLEVYTTGGVQLALEASQHYRTLRSRGITIRKTVDCLIATYCIRHEFALLHKDRDFDPFEQHLGLRVVRPGFGPVQ
jgi:predicted nucleic acid-binding protein